MKRPGPAVILLGALLLTGCALTGPGNLRVHEVLLYGGTQERVVWVYGDLGASASSQVKLGETSVELRPQVSDPLAVAGSLSINGRATYRLPTSPFQPKLSVTAQAGSYVVSGNDPAVLALYATDGVRWTRLSALAGVAVAQPVSGLQGAGQLTDDEARALGGALLGQGPLTVAVLDPARVPDAALKVEPAPASARLTALYLLPGPSVPGASALSGVPVTFTEVASGTQSGATAAMTLLATTPATAAALYATAYARQTPQPTPPALSGDTLVGVFIGQRSTGGYGVKVLSARGSGGVLTLTVQLTAPGAGMLTTQALTSPFAIVRVPGVYSAVQVVDERGQPLPTGGAGGGEVR